MKSCSLIIVAYYSRYYLRSAVRSAIRGLKNFGNWEIIVVSNGSDADEQDLLLAEFPQVQWIENESNLGFGKACNIGAERAQFDTLFFLNPDTFCTQSSFDGLYQKLQDPQNGLVGGKILNPDGSLQLACRRSFPTTISALAKITGIAHFWPQSKLFGQYNMTFLPEDDDAEVDAVSGSFFGISAEVYQQVAGFDTRFFLYGEDLDLCYRVKEAGYKVLYTPDAEIMHLKGRSAAVRPIRSLFHFYKAMGTFAHKHRSYYFLPVLLIQLGIWFAFGLSLIKQKVRNLSLLLGEVGAFATSILVAQKDMQTLLWLIFPILMLLNRYKTSGSSALKWFCSILLGGVGIWGYTQSNSWLSLAPFLLIFPASEYFGFMKSIFGKRKPAFILGADGKGVHLESLAEIGYDILGIVDFSDNPEGVSKLYPDLVLDRNEWKMAINIIGKNTLSIFDINKWSDFPEELQGNLSMVVPNSSEPKYWEFLNISNLWMNKKC